MAIYMMVVEKTTDWTRWTTLGPRRLKQSSWWVGVACVYTWEVREGKRCDGIWDGGGWAQIWGVMCGGETWDRNGLSRMSR